MIEKKRGSCLKLEKYENNGSKRKIQIIQTNNNRNLYTAPRTYGKEKHISTKMGKIPKDLQVEEEMAFRNMKNGRASGSENWNS